METRQTAAPAAKGADRVLSVFKALARYPRGATLDELAERLASPKSSVHRALATLRRAGLAEQDGDGRYRFGMEALRLAFAYYEGLDQRVVVQPALDALVDLFGETAHYAHLDGGEEAYAATHPLVARTPATLVTPGALHSDLEGVRARGYSIDREENEAGVGCVA